MVFFGTDLGQSKVDVVGVVVVFRGVDVAAAERGIGELLRQRSRHFAAEVAHAWRGVGHYVDRRGADDVGDESGAEGAAVPRVFGDAHERRNHGGVIAVDVELGLADE